MVDHRMQRARLMVRRAVQRQHERPARVQHGAQRVQDARLTDTCLARDQRHLRFAGADTFPAMHQQAKFAVAPDHRGHRPGMHRVEPALGHALAMYLPHDDGHGKTFQMHRAQAGAVEQPLGEPMRACTYDDAVRRRLGLQPRSKVRRLADDADAPAPRPRRSYRRPPRARWRSRSAR